MLHIYYKISFQLIGKKYTINLLPVIDIHYSYFLEDHSLTFVSDYGVVVSRQTFFHMHL